VRRISSIIRLTESDWAQIESANWKKFKHGTEALGFLKLFKDSNAIEVLYDPKKLQCREWANLYLARLRLNFNVKVSKPRRTSYRKHEFKPATWTIEKLA
jgi:hypothetical protein